MIHDVDPHQRAGRHQPRRQRDVVFAWRRVAGRMVVEQHDRGRAADDSLAVDGAGIRVACIEGPDRHQPGADDAMARVEQQHAEALHLPRAELRHQVRGGVARMDDLRPELGAADERSAPQLDRRHHLRPFRRTQSDDAPEVLPPHAGQPMHAAGGLEERVCDVERAPPARPMTDHNRDQLVVAERGRSDTVEFFARPIVRRKRFHRIIETPMLRATLPIAVIAIAATIGCSEPPNKEMHQAQGAIDAARAAGAEQYARDEFDAARTALSRSEEAVRARDYRLALSHALDASERAQDAAREAANRKAAARSQAERALLSADAAVKRAQARLATLSAARPARRDLADIDHAIDVASQAVQESRAALAKEDYLGAAKALDGVEARLDAVLRGVRPPARPRSGRGR